MRGIISYQRREREGNLMGWRTGVSLRAAKPREDWGFAVHTTLTKETEVKLLFSFPSRACAPEHVPPTPGT